MTPAEQLARWVEIKHAGQLIRRTDEPYFDHLTAVAVMAKQRAVLGYEIGLCHDIFEETETTLSELLASLHGFGYTSSEAGHIASCVTELTDVYTADAYPHLGKKERKAREAARLITISADAQTVKYCDLIYNIRWVLQYDYKHAKKYLKKKRLLLVDMANGDQELRQQALTLIDKVMPDA